MNRIYKGLKILSSLESNKWKIGKTDEYINSIFSKVSSLPPHVFDGFYLATSLDKKISTVDFALMTYDMSLESKKQLMDAYSIDMSTLSAIQKVADEIGEEIETQDALETLDYSSLGKPYKSNKESEDMEI